MNCNVCEALMEDGEGVAGYFGMLPVAFCVWCTPSMTDMVIQMQGFDDIDILKERIKELEEDAKQESKAKKTREKKKT